MSKLINPAEYETATLAAARLSLTRAYVARLAKAGRIAGAIRVGAEDDDPRGRLWLIPKAWAGVKPAKKDENS